MQMAVRGSSTPMVSAKSSNMTKVEYAPQPVKQVNKPKMRHFTKNMTIRVKRVNDLELDAITERSERNNTIASP